MQAISNEVGSGQICSVENDEMFTEDMKLMFSVDLDMRPSSLLVGEDEAPVDFEWSCEVTCLFEERTNSECQTGLERVQVK